MNENELICICGHTFKQHDMPLGHNQSSGVCWYAGHNLKRHPCREFKLDNLKTLENRYDEQNRIDTK